VEAALSETAVSGFVYVVSGALGQTMEIAAELSVLQLGQMLLGSRVAAIVAVALAQAALSRLVLVNVDCAVDVKESVLVDVAAELGG